MIKKKKKVIKKSIDLKFLKFSSLWLIKSFL